MRGLVIKDGKVVNVIVIDASKAEAFRVALGADEVIDEASVTGEKPQIDWARNKSRDEFTKPVPPPQPVINADGSYINVDGYICTPPVPK